jgi:hypothetical protein
MHEPDPLRILSRAAMVIAVVVALILGNGYLKKRKHLAAIAGELRAIAADSSFFRQFYPEDARKALLRAVGLIAEADALGVDPLDSVDRAIGGDAGDFSLGMRVKRPSDPRQDLVRNALLGNHNHLLKLGYSFDAATIKSLKEGVLPPIPSGPHRGQRPELVMLIPPELSPGIDRVMANLEIRPPRDGLTPRTDTEVALAKQLAHDLAMAGVIEDAALERILAGLEAPAAAPDAAPRHGGEGAVK